MRLWSIMWSSYVILLLQPIERNLDSLEVNMEECLLNAHSLYHLHFKRLICFASTFTVLMMIFLLQNERNIRLLLINQYDGISIKSMPLDIKQTIRLQSKKVPYKRKDILFIIKNSIPIKLMPFAIVMSYYCTVH